MAGSDRLKIVIAQIEINSIFRCGLFAPQIARGEPHGEHVLRLLALRIGGGVLKNKDPVDAIDRAGFAPHITRQSRVCDRIDITYANLLSHFLADHQSYNEIYGTTNNPWDVSRTPGGSSGGSAAALAAGLTGIDAGSDIGGSIRNPAHYCGVFGLKPTWGVIAPKGQALPGTHAYADLSVIGPLARGAEDLELALDAMAGPDEIDGAAWKLDLPACAAKSLRDLRVAVKLTDPNSDVDAEYADKLQALVDALAKRGARVKEIEPKLDTRRLHEVYVLLLRAATSARTPEVDVVRWRQAAIEIGAAKEPYLDRTVRGNTLSHRDWLKLNNERHGLRRAFAAFFADWDVLLCPAAASAAWPHDQKGERWTRKIMVNGTQVPSTDQLFWAGYSSLVYLPSTVGPAGLTKSGLPVGYQAIAASGRDKTATAFSRLVEKEMPASFLHRALIDLSLHDDMRRRRTRCRQREFLSR